MDIISLQFCRICIEDSLYKAEKRVKDGEFTAEYGRKWFGNIKGLIKKIFSTNVSNELDPKPELLYRLRKSIEIKPEDIKESLQAQFGFLRFIFYVVSTPSTLCEFQNGELVVHFDLNYHTNAIKKIKAGFTPETQYDRIFQEFYGMAELNLSENEASSFFIADTCTDLIPDLIPDLPNTSKTEYYCALNLDFWLISRKILVKKNNCGDIVAEGVQIDMGILSNDKKGEVFELLARAYEEKKILTLAIEKAKNAKECYSVYFDFIRPRNNKSEKNKEEMSDYIKYLEDKNTKTVQKPPSNTSNNATVVEKNTDIDQDIVKHNKEYLVVFDDYIEPLLMRLEAQLQSGNFQMSEVNQMTTDLNDYLDKRKENENFNELKLQLNHRLCMFINLKNIPEDDIEYIMSVIRFYTNVLVVIDTSCVMDVEDYEKPYVNVLTNLFNILEKFYGLFGRSNISSQMIKDIAKFRSRAYQINHFPACYIIAKWINTPLQKLPVNDDNIDQAVENSIDMMKCIDIQKYHDQILELTKDSLSCCRKETHRAVLLELKSKAYQYKEIYSLAIKNAKEAQEAYTDEEDKKRLLQHIDYLQSLQREKERRQELLRLEESRIPYNEEAEEEYFDSLDFFVEDDEVVDGDDCDMFNMAENKIICGEFDEKYAEEFRRQAASGFIGYINKRTEQVHCMLRITNGIGDVIEKCEFSDNVFISCLRYLFYGMNGIGVFFSNPKEGKTAQVSAHAYELFQFAVNGLLVQKVKHDEIQSSKTLAKAIFEFKGDYDRAVAGCKAVLKLATEFDMEHTDQKIKALETMARAFEKLNRREAAIARIDEAIEICQNTDKKSELQSLKTKFQRTIQTRESVGASYLVDDNIRKDRERQNKIQSRHHKKKRRRYKKQEMVTPEDDANFQNKSENKVQNVELSTVTPISDTESDLSDDYIDSETYSLTTAPSTDNLSLFSYSQSDVDQDESISDEEVSVPQETWYETSIKVMEGHEKKTEHCLQYDVDLRERFDFQENLPKWEIFYPAMMTRVEMEQNIQANPVKYKKCIINVDSSQSATCTTTENPIGEQIVINGRSKCGQTFSGDEVCVEIIGKANDKDCGKVVGIFKRNRSDTKNPVFLCTITGEEAHLMGPICKTVPKISIFHNQVLKRFSNIPNSKIEVYKMDKKKSFKFSHFFTINPAKRQQYIFVVVYLNWSPKFAYPKGMVIDVIQNYKDYQASLKILGNQFAIDPIYPSEVIQEIVGMKKDDSVPSYDFDVLTIDPKGSKDLDDALHITRLSENIFEVGVHIADVAHFVVKGSEIDKEAERRATSFYPEDSRSIHMLPEPLSEDRCSLREREVRRTISVIFKLDANGEQLNEPVIQRSFVRSMQQLTYHEAQLIINGHRDGFSDTINGMITDLYRLSKSIRRSRLKKRLYHVQYSDGFLRGENETNETEAHDLVEEYMIMTNCHIGQIITEQFPRGILLRVQQPPDDKKLVQWFGQNQPVGNLILYLQGYSCQSSNGNLSLSLDNNHSDGHLTVQKSVWTEVLRAKEAKDWKKLQSILCMDDIHPSHFIARTRWNGIMESAEYKLCSGARATGSHHFTLNFNLYTHFTSPLRRFVDLINHRFIHAYLDKKKAPYTTHELQMISLHLGRRAKQQKLYGKHSKTLKLAYELTKQPAQIMGFISQADNDGVEIEIPQWPFLKANNDIPFHLLDVCERPTVKDTLTETSWRKRSFHTLGAVGHVRPEMKRREKLQLNPIKHCLNIPLKMWADLLTNLISSTESEDKQRSKRCKKEVEKIIDQIGMEGINPIGTLYGTVDKVTCEGGRSNISSLTDMCRFSFKFAPGRVLCTQLSTVFEKGLPKPKFTMVKLADNLIFCLEHKDDPVTCLTKESFESTKGRKWIQISEYVKAWSALVEMEAAVQSVQGGDTFFIEHVPVRFTTQDSGSFTFNHSFCSDRDVLGSIHISKDEKEKPITDFVCIRKEVAQDSDNPFIWVGHGQMVYCCKSEDYMESNELEVYFELHGTETSSSKMRDVINIGTQDVFTLEIIPRSETDRRLKDVLKKKVIESNPLVKAIVLNSSIPVLDRDHLDLGKKIEKDLPKEELQILKLPGNNIKQHEAIEKSLTSAFTLIQGPPGTGKTYTGIKLVYLFTKINKIIKLEEPAKKGDKTIDGKNQVLYCGPSNKSVDVVARNLIKKLGNRCPKIVRVYGRTVVFCDFPVPGRASPSRAARREGQCPEDLHNVALHHIIRQKGKPYADKICEFDKKFKKEIQFPESQGITKMMIKTYHKLVRQAEEEELPLYEAILCTTGVGGNKRTMKNLKVFQCIIDECGMCTEPETLLPILVAKPNQLVLIGDHKQLRPILMCSKAAKLGLEKSLFERYAEKAIFLNIQYRMHPDICAFPSKQFYEGKLETGPSTLWEIKQPLRIIGGKKIMFFHIEGEEEALTVHTDDGHERSKSNIQEVDKVMLSQRKLYDYQALPLVDLFRHMVRNEDINPRSINIMTQYKSQMSLIQKKIKEYNFDNTVNTVVASQGGEWDYVILSTVRSLPLYKIEPFPTRGWRTENLGFLADENQTNVALTRARKGLLIIGNKNVLKCDTTWRALLLHYEKQGCIQDANNIPSSAPPRAAIPIIGRYKSAKNGPYPFNMI
ncbi:hypothetical protein LOTGIDRAFT_235246 [Lottia gigantea]|uniref:RNB domain-containing protein n=1 Tax=Lottia gigantea TaxID=225164 RepID=V4A037_LOTGI|nr:hypothetical protein LOTGIDRAFT_235246 [Lottia gigantea]ESO86616.1 hypothetical protein LOTGIDRAFT_235246 [Lottia gigantea]